MSFNFRDIAPVIGSNAQVEFNNGAGPATLVNLQLFEAVSVANVAAAGAVNQVLFTCPPIASTATGALPFGNYKLAGVSVRFSTASTSGTLQIEKTPSGTAVASGTNLLTGTVSLAGTANTVVSGQPSSTLSAASMTLSPGDSLSAIFGGTLTNLAGMTITLYVIRVS